MTQQSKSSAETTPPLRIIAHIRTDFPEKFGVPRQSGLVPQADGRIVFEPALRNPDALRGIDGFSHLWLIWSFHKAQRAGLNATVRPPRLGGNTRMGVFATRSPFRPNALGLSCVRLKRVAWDTPQGPVLIVGGVDMVDGTPIFDIKPYLPLTDCHPDALAGFTEDTAPHTLRVVFPPSLQSRVEPCRRQTLIDLLAQDPRPSYQRDPSRVYGMTFAGCNVRFTVDQDVLTVLGVQRMDDCSFETEDSSDMRSGL